MWLNCQHLMMSLQQDEGLLSANEQRMLRLEMESTSDEDPVSIA